MFHTGVNSRFVLVVAAETGTAVLAAVAAAAAAAAVVVLRWMVRFPLEIGLCVCTCLCWRCFFFLLEKKMSLVVFKFSDMRIFFLFSLFQFSLVFLLNEKPSCKPSFFRNSLCPHHSFKIKGNGSEKKWLHE